MLIVCADADRTFAALRPNGIVGRRRRRADGGGGIPLEKTAPVGRSKGGPGSVMR
jgi:hypothetical protein